VLLQENKQKNERRWRSTLLTYIKNIKRNVKNRKSPVTVPEGVEISQVDGNVVTVKGKKGELTQEMDSCVSMSMKVEGSV
jgi:hypothetical protein